MNGKSFFDCLLIALVFFSSALVCSVSANFIPPYEHHISIYIKADGSIEPSDAPIQRDGDVFRLTGNLSIGIAIKRSNITFEGNGFAIVGNGSGSGCLILSDGVLAQHLYLVAFDYGIYVSGSNCRVEANTLRNCSMIVAGVSAEIVDNLVDRTISLSAISCVASQNSANRITVSGSTSLFVKIQ